MALYLTGAAAVFILVSLNLSLRLTSQNYCIVACQVPFSDQSFRLPYWTWKADILLLPLSLAFVLAIWISVALQCWKRKRSQSSAEAKLEIMG